jgi:CBS domain-containing protein
MQPQSAQTSARAQRRTRLQPTSVEEIVSTDVVTAQRDTPIRTVVAQMAEQDVGSVVIVEDRTPVGILTDRQVALSLETTPDIADRRADEILTGDLVTGTTEMSVLDVLQKLQERGIRRLPIVDDNGALQGIVTLDDVLVLLGTELNNATQIVQSQSPRL